MGIPQEIQEDARKHFLRIRELNDALRTHTDPIGALMMNGQLVITDGIASRGNEFIAKAAAAVRAFDDFKADDDLHGEHDMAFLVVDGERIFFKVDYYDYALKWHSPDPSDPG